jgi:uncharacterized cupredoxin-like copper-binding protein
MRTPPGFQAWTALLAALSAALLSAPLGSARAEEEYDPLIVISMGDHFFEVPGTDRDTPITVKAGRLYFLQIRNDGKQEHNVEWGRGVLTKDGMPDIYATHLMGHVPVKIMNKAWDVAVDGLRDLNMKPGQEVELEVMFPESARGDWEIGCFRPGHYDAGMRVPFIVE